MEIHIGNSNTSDPFNSELEFDRSKGERDIRQLNPALKNLTIVGQPLHAVPEIDYLNNLQGLWLIDCSIQNADEVAKCKNLRRLILYSNKLTRTPKQLSNLQHLKVLWLAGNNITEIDKYGFPPNLEDLNLADNKITSIKNTFGKCFNLKNINLSGNPLQSIFEIHNLRVIRTLKSLTLYDPMYDVCAITRVPTYRSFVIKCLPRLERLDSFNIEEQEIELIKMFYDNKELYYNVVMKDTHYNFYSAKREQREKEFLELTKIKKKLWNLSHKIHEPKNEHKLELYESIQTVLNDQLFEWEEQNKTKYNQMETCFNANITHTEMELQYFGFLKIKTLSHNTTIAENIGKKLNSFICPYMKKNLKINQIDIIQVTFVINSSFHPVEEAELIFDSNEWVESSDLYMLCEPLFAENSYESFYNYITKTVHTNEANYMKETISQCFILTDESLSCAYTIAQNNEANPSRRRVIALGFFRKDNTTILQTAMHCEKKSNTSSSCEIRLINEKEFSPLILVAFSYDFEKEKAQYTEKQEAALSNLESNLSLKRGFEIYHSKMNFTLSKVTITHQNLSSFGLSEPLPNVLELDVSYNEFYILSEIFYLFPNLQRLNASFNEISSITNCSVMRNMKDLDLSWNAFEKLFPNLMCLKETCPELKILNLKYNILLDVHEDSHSLFFVSKFLTQLCSYNLINICDLSSETMNEYYFDLLDKDNKIPILNYPTEQQSKYYWHNYRSMEECISITGKSYVVLNQFKEIINLTLVNGVQFHNITFVNCVRNVTTLKISRNKLLGTQFIQHMPNLTELDLSFNILTSINIQGLKKIERLYINSNYISSLKNFDLTDLSSMKVLDVSFNHLKNLDGLENAVNLEELYICHNEILDVDSYLCVKKYKKLKSIDVRQNSLKQMDVLKHFLAFHMPDLQYINGSNITEDEILEANNAFGGVLDAEYLQALDKNDEFKNINHINLFSSSIKVISINEADLKHITSMNLENNSLITFAELLPLTNLRLLCLSRNQICKFGEAPENLLFRKLEELYLDSNHISSLETLELYRMPKLKTLFLQDNELTTIKGIHKLSELKNLVLNRNKITYISQIDTRKLIKIKELHIQSNFLENVEFLQSLIMMGRLFIQDNKIQSIEKLKPIKALLNLEELHLSGNPVCSNNCCYIELLSNLPNLNVIDGICIGAQAPETPEET